MQTLTIPIVNAFVDGKQGGNPAGIVLQADRFDSATKQLIATQVGLSETAFVSASSVADVKLEFFTPARQIAQCGHATIATFSYLAQQGVLTKERSVMETVDGPRAISLEGDQAFMQQTAPTFTAPERLHPEVTVPAILRSLALSTTDLIDGLLPTVVNTGNSFLVVPLRSAQGVSRVVPDLAAIDRISSLLGLVGYYVFSQETQQAGRDAGARMFAPYYGIAEEAATGMAAGPLACYLYTFLHQQKATFAIEQGHLMQPPSPSVLTARLQLDQGNITGLDVGGRAAVSHSVDITV
ncbi:PhzF family phenazine biosynthesis protein [Spirosoma knui]